MLKYLGSYIKEQRLKQNLNTAELAKNMRYKNINKGMRRIVDIERGESFHPDVLKRIVSALELDQDYFYSLVLKDREEYEEKFEKWVSEPIEPYYTLRMMPAIYLSYELPDNIKTEDEAIKYASSIAIEHKSIVWLVLSRKVNYHIDSDGNIKSRNEVTIECSWLPRTRIK